MRLINDRLRVEVNKFLPNACNLTKNVLVIDDESKSLSAFRAMFRKSFNVFTASTLDEAIGYIENNKIDIVFCDYVLDAYGKDNGADVLQVIYNRYPDIKRVALTGYNSKEHRMEFESKSNTTTVLEKPCTFDDVINQIVGYNLHLAS